MDDILEDKNYSEQLAEMWGEHDWLFDTIAGNPNEPSEDGGDDSFDYFQQVLKSMQQPEQLTNEEGMPATAGDVQYNTELFDKVGGTMGSYFKKIFQAESGGKMGRGNPYGSAYGPYQFIKSTWTNLCRKYGLNYSLADRNDMQKATHVMQLFTEENRRGLRKTLGREPTHGELYLAHFLGLGGAQQFLRHSNGESLGSVFSRAILKANPYYCYDKKRGRYRTVGELKQLLGEKMR